MRGKKPQKKLSSGKPDPRVGADCRDANGLNLREARFVLEYISNSGNGKQAAQAAGFSGDFAARSSHLLARPRVRAVIDKLRTEKLSEIDARADRVLQELVRCAFFSPKRLFAPDGSPLPLSQLDPDTAAAISSFELGKNGSPTKYRFANKSQALELLGDYLHLWQQPASGVSVGVNVAINNSGCDLESLNQKLVEMCKEEGYRSAFLLAVHTADQQTGRVGLLSGYSDEELAGLLCGPLLRERLRTLIISVDEAHEELPSSYTVGGPNDPHRPGGPLDPRIIVENWRRRDRFSPAADREEITKDYDS